jgi:hypothetical protein
MLARNTPLPRQKTMVPSAKLRSRNSDRSRMGCSSVVSHSRKAMKPSTDTSASTMTWVDPNQSAFLPVSSMICSAPAQTTSRPSPTMSMGSLAVALSRAARLLQHNAATTSPTGTLTRKIQPQFQESEI